MTWDLTGEQTGIWGTRRWHKTGEAAAASALYYYDGYDVGGDEFGGNPGSMVDGSISTSAVAAFGSETQKNTSLALSSGTETGTITKVEVRAHGSMAGTPTGLDLRPLFGGSNNGDLHDLKPSWGAPLQWSSWFDITSDTNAPGTWSWADIAAMDMLIIFLRNAGDAFNDRCSCEKMEVRIS